MSSLPGVKLPGYEDDHLSLTHAKVMKNRTELCLQSPIFVQKKGSPLQLYPVIGRNNAHTHFSNRFISLLVRTEHKSTEITHIAYSISLANFLVQQGGGVHMLIYLSRISDYENRLIPNATGLILT
jgi:hypothetical protein